MTLALINISDVPDFITILPVSGTGIPGLRFSGKAACW